MTKHMLAAVATAFFAGFSAAMLGVALLGPGAPSAPLHALALALCLTASVLNFDLARRKKT